MHGGNLVSLEHGLLVMGKLRGQIAVLGGWCPDAKRSVDVVGVDVVG